MAQQLMAALSLQWGCCCFVLPCGATQLMKCHTRPASCLAACTASSQAVNAFAASAIRQWLNHHPVLSVPGQKPIPGAEGLLHAQLPCAVTVLLLLGEVHTAAA
jgi:hypothetical protein